MRENTDALDDLMVEIGGGEEKLEVVLRRTQYRLEVAENANAAMLARSQKQAGANSIGGLRLEFWLKTGLRFHLDSVTDVSKIPIFEPFSRCSVLRNLKVKTE